MRFDVIFMILELSLECKVADDIGDGILELYCIIERYKDG